MVIWAAAACAVCKPAEAELVVGGIGGGVGEVAMGVAVAFQRGKQGFDLDDVGEGAVVFRAGWGLCGMLPGQVDGEPVLHR